MYAFIPYIASYWAYANTRVAPFLWLAALVRVPEQLPKRLVAVLAACTVLYSASLGIDYVRLDRDRKEFTSGIPYVPEHARLLPLIFRSKGVAENTRPLSHTWGFYVLAKQTSAPLIFASSRLYGVTYREPPNPQIEHIALEGFSGRMRDSGWLCHEMRQGGIQVGDCVETWRQYWREFWELMQPRFDTLLLWDPVKETEEQIPRAYREVFRNGRLVILRRDPDDASVGP
jgi:hypothetical protein